MKIPSDIQTVLPVHTQENPFVIDSYPYGRLRCVKRVWLETKKNKGTRCVGQTQNPKNQVWNKPHASTYAEFSGAMYLDSEGHVQWTGLTQYDELETISAFLETFGENCTNHAEVVKWKRKHEIKKEELDKAGNPDYGTPDFQKAHSAMLARFKQEGI